ncbi:MAG: type II toxin-antitoxin system RelE/ParE family toxin [Halothiobacillaceae bacterium]|nr:type II toxin-antitoxin system RelE/ParE family toxin [Halothiobacillaceae bacterium]
MAWRIELDPAAQRELSKLDPQIAKRVLVFLHGRVALLDDPRSIGEALKGSRLGELWKYRVGDYRIIASTEDGALRILVVRVGNCREVYRKARKPIGARPGCGC